MRWLRRVLVVAVLAAPIAVVVAIARPDGGSAGASETRADGSGPDGELVDGDRVNGALAIGEVAVFEALGDGSTRIGATAPGADLTIRVRDGDGDELASNDDTNGLDPEVTVELTEGEAVTVEVRELGNQPAGFTVYVDG